MLKVYETSKKRQEKNLADINKLRIDSAVYNYLPNEESAETEQENSMLALSWTIRELWVEARLCFIYCRYISSVLVLSTVIEAILKRELIKKGLNNSNKLTLGDSIKKCIDEHILKKNLKTTKAAWDITKIRNDIIHLNVQRNKPLEYFSFNKDLHEYKPTNSSRGGYYVNDYRNAAKKVLKNTKLILGYISKKASKKTI